MSFLPQPCPHPNDRLNCELDSVTICPPTSGIAFETSCGFDFATVSAVPADTVSTVLAPVNLNRQLLIIYNDSSATLRILLGSPASSNLFTVALGANASYEFECYRGIVTGIWETATGQAMVTEGEI